MAKVKFSAAAGVETGLNFGEGFGEVVEIEAIVHQFPANRTTGEQSPEATMIRMMIQRTDADGKKTMDDPVEEFFGCGSLEKFHPGRVDGPEDDEPEDQGTEIGASGNCLWSDGSSINKKSKWHIFTSSLDAKGFKASVLDSGYLPDLVGLRAEFTSIDMPKDKDRTYKRDPKALVVKNILYRPYEGKPKGKGNTASAAVASKANGKATSPASSPTPAPTSVGADDDGVVDSTSTQILQSLGTKMAGEVLPRTKIISKLFGVLATGVGQGPIPPKLHKPIQAQFKNDAWLAERCQDLDYEIDTENITFPAVEGGGAGAAA